MKLIDEMSQLRRADFDRRYAENELAYHKAVNDLVENAFIPNIENADEQRSSLQRTNDAVLLLSVSPIHDSHRKPVGLTLRYSGSVTAFTPDELDCQ